MFTLSEFALESIIRQGLEEFKVDIDMRLDDVFGRLRLPDIMAKYGNNEIKKIKEIIMRTPINIVQAQTQLENMKMPAISIHLLGDTESEKNASINDYDGESQTPINPEVIVPIFTITSYDSATGLATVSDSVDLSQVYENRFLKDGLGQSYQILDPISNINGEKSFSIAKNITGLELTNCTIVSAVNVKVHQIDYIPTDENIMIGIHAENALLSKYLYAIIRYILYRKKAAFHEYQLELSKYNGSDWALVQVFTPEGCHSRWITAQFIAYNYWRGDEKFVVDAINPNVGGVGSFLEIECDFIPDSYDTLTGLISVQDSVDLSSVQPGDWFFDGAGNLFKIYGGIDNTPGGKEFQIDAGQIVDLTKGCIKRKYTIRAIAESDREDEADYTWETDVK